jgi:hypothetical protein
MKEGKKIWFYNLQKITWLLDNVRVVKFLSDNYPDILEELQKIVEMTSLASPDE